MKTALVLIAMMLSGCQYSGELDCSIVDAWGRDGMALDMLTVKPGTDQALYVVSLDHTCAVKLMFEGGYCSGTYTTNHVGCVETSSNDTVWELFGESGTYRIQSEELSFCSEAGCESWR